MTATTIRIPITAYLEADIVFDAGSGLVGQNLAGAVIAVTAATRTLVVEHDGIRILSIPLELPDGAAGVLPVSAVRDYDEPLPLDTPTVEETK